MMPSCYEMDLDLKKGHVVVLTGFSKAFDSLPKGYPRSESFRASVHAVNDAFAKE